MKRLALFLALGTALASFVPAASAAACEPATCQVKLISFCGEGSSYCPICLDLEKPITAWICTP